MQKSQFTGCVTKVQGRLKQRKFSAAGVPTALNIPAGHAIETPVMVWQTKKGSAHLFVDGSCRFLYDGFGMGA
jgi:hypothetical protein